MSIGLGSASQIALFVAPMLALLSYVIGPEPVNLQFWPGAVVMVLVSTMTASLVTSSGRSAWFVGVLVLMVYMIFAMTLYLLPPRSQGKVKASQPPQQLQHARRSAGQLWRMCPAGSNEEVVFTAAAPASATGIGFGWAKDGGQRHRKS